MGIANGKLHNWTTLREGFLEVSAEPCRQRSREVRLGSAPAAPVQKWMVGDLRL